MPFEVTLGEVAGVGMLLCAILGFIYRELRRIDRRISALATLTLMNAENSDTRIPENVQDALIPNND